MKRAVRRGAARPAVAAPRQARDLARADRATSSAASASDGVFGLADEHAVHLRRARHRLRRRASTRAGRSRRAARRSAAFSAPSAATSASSVGVVLGKTISVGSKPSRVELRDHRLDVERVRRSASTRRTSQPAFAQQRGAAARACTAAWSCRAPPRVPGSGPAG